MFSSRGQRKLISPPPPNASHRAAWHIQCCECPTADDHGISTLTFVKDDYDWEAPITVHDMDNRSYEIIIKLEFKPRVETLPSGSSNVHSLG